MVSISDIPMCAQFHHEIGKQAVVSGFQRSCQSKAKDLRAGAFWLIDTSSSVTLKISCFSMASDSLLMWAHYADKHYGVVIKFDI